ncbi:Rv0361 family membrane protein [Nocardioides zeae]
MSDALPPRPDQSQPQPGRPPARDAGARRGLVVGLAVLLGVLLLGGGTWALVAATSDDAPGSVRETAEQAVDAAEALDVDAGARLLCSAPSDDERADLEDAIDEAREQTGTDDPEVAYEISDVEESDDGGSVVVRATADEEELGDAFLEVRFDVTSDDGEFCIDEIEVLDGSGP